MKTNTHINKWWYTQKKMPNCWLFRRKPVSIILVSAVIYENYCNIYNIFPETHKVKGNYRERLNKSISNGGQQHKKRVFIINLLFKIACVNFSQFTLYVTIFLLFQLTCFYFPFECESSFSSSCRNITKETILSLKIKIEKTENKHLLPMFVHFHCLFFIIGKLVLLLITNK